MSFNTQIEGDSFIDYLKLDDTYGLGNSLNIRDYKPPNLFRIKNFHHSLTAKNSPRVFHKKISSELTSKVFKAYYKKNNLEQNKQLSFSRLDTIQSSTNHKARRRTQLSQWMNNAVKETISTEIKLPPIKIKKSENTYSELLTLQDDYNRYSSLLKNAKQMNVFPKTMKQLRRQRDASKKQHLILKKLKEVCK